ncbi:hypothetical protein ACFWH7_19595 [Cellulosimicrobium cellulans]|uniref:hypothetical protein n=1 Tax=Cellulosimicrobium cellulans TaxID=1710 RepID=UPI003657CD21
MAKGIEIPLVADVAPFLKGMESAVDKVDELADVFDDAADASQRAGDAGERAARETGAAWGDAASRVEREFDGVEDAVEEAGREGESAAERVARAWDEAVREVRRRADDGAKDVKDSFQRNSLSADDVFDASFRAEMRASANETGSEILGQISSALADGSIDASTLATSLSEGLVEIGAEVGGPAGAAMVAGGLIASALWGQVTAAKEAVQADVTAMFDSILEQGAAAAEQGQVLANIRELTENQDKLNYSTKLAADLEVELATVIRARAGDVEAMNEIDQVQHDKQMQLLDAYNAGTIAADDYRRASEDISEATKDVTADFELERKGIDAAKTATDAFRDATNAAAATQVDNAAKLAASTGKAQTFTTTIDGATRSLKVMPDGKVIDVTDNGSAELTQEQINNIRGKEVTLTASMAVWQAQAAVDAVARMLRPPTVPVYLRGGMRAV